MVVKNNINILNLFKKKKNLFFSLKSKNSISNK
jgi:hypothetical protein